MTKTSDTFLLTKNRLLNKSPWLRQVKQEIFPGLTTYSLIKSLYLMMRLILRFGEKDPDKRRMNIARSG